MEFESAYSLTSLVLCGLPTRTWEMVSSDLRTSLRQTYHSYHLIQHSAVCQPSSLSSLKKFDLILLPQTTRDSSPCKAASAVLAVCCRQNVRAEKAPASLRTFILPSWQLLRGCEFHWWPLRGLFPLKPALMSD